MAAIGTWGREFPVVATGCDASHTGEGGGGLATAELLIIGTLEVRGGEAGEAGGRGHGGAAWGAWGEGGIVLLLHGIKTITSIYQ